MTLLGKVFTGIVFVLSVVFFVIAVAINSTHINQKAEANKQKAIADSTKRDNEQLQKLLESLKRELAIEQMARRSALAALQTQVTKLAEDLSSKENELRQLQSSHTELTSAERTTSEQLKTRTNDNEQLRKQIQSTREDRNQLLERLVKTKQEFITEQGYAQRLEERMAKLHLDNNLVTQKMQALGIRPETMLDAPPEVQGEVLAVAEGMIEVSLGSDDGIREGFVLEVHRGGQYLGRAKVRTVRNHKSVADILTGYQKGYIQAGDRVNSKLF
jgi:uncharacterized protein YpmS